MNIVEILKAILFGIVEGITEWLPISSTGHMILLEEFVSLDVSNAFWEMFLVVIQLGAILAVVVLFWNMIVPFDFRSYVNQKKSNGSHGRSQSYVNQHDSQSYVNQNDSKHESQDGKSYVNQHGSQGILKKDTLLLWLKIIIACLPAAIIGLLFDDLFTALFYNYVSVAIALIVFGILFIIVETLNKDREFKINSIAEITYQVAIIIGLFQVIAAIFPGTSRSGVTIVGALMIGVSRRAAAEFTFVLAIPVMFGASLLKIAKFGMTFSANEVIILLVGMITAFIVSILTIRFLLGYIRKHDFKVFGWYRIVLGVVVLVYFAVSA